MKRWQIILGGALAAVLGLFWANGFHFTPQPNPVQGWQFVASALLCASGIITAALGGVESW